MQTAVYVNRDGTMSFGEELDRLVGQMGVAFEIGPALNILEFRTDELKIAPPWGAGVPIRCRHRYIARGLGRTPTMAVLTRWNRLLTGFRPQVRRFSRHSEGCLQLETLPVQFRFEMPSFQRPNEISGSAS